MPGDGFAKRSTSGFVFTSARSSKEQVDIRQPNAKGKSPPSLAISKCATKKFMRHDENKNRGKSLTTNRTRLKVRAVITNEY
jgi:hypothetical protein